MTIKWGICKICKNKYKGYGHNAEPIIKGKCCNACNYMKVIPARLTQIQEMNENEV